MIGKNLFSLHQPHNLRLSSCASSRCSVISTFLNWNTDEVLTTSNVATHNDNINIPGAVSHNHNHNHNHNSQSKLSNRYCSNNLGFALHARRSTSQSRFNLRFNQNLSVNRTKHANLSRCFSSSAKVNDNDDDKEGNEKDQGNKAEKKLLPQKEVYKRVGIMTISQFVNNCGFGCVIPVLPLFAAEMGLGASGVGLILSSSAISRLVFNLPLSRLADSIGRKPPMVAGQLMTATASIATGLCGGLPALLACRLLLGAGTISALAGSSAYMADLTANRPEDRAKILGFQSTVINLAYAFGPALGGWLCDIYGARMSFFIVGGAALITCAGFSALPESLNKPKPILSLFTKKEQNNNDTASLAKPSMWSVYKPLLQNPDQQSAMALHFAIFTSYSALMTVFPLHAATVLGADGSASNIGNLFAAAAVVGFAGAPLGGILADKIGRKPTIIPAATVIAIGAMLTSQASTFNELLGSVMIWGVGNSMSNPGLAAFTADISKDESTRAQTLSLSRFAGDSAFLVAPFGLGLLASFTDCATSLYCTSAIILIANSMFALRATESSTVSK